MTLEEAVKSGLRISIGNEGSVDERPEVGAGPASPTRPAPTPESIIAIPSPAPQPAPQSAPQSPKLEVTSATEPVVIPEHLTEAELVARLRIAGYLVTKDDRPPAPPAPIEPTDAQVVASALPPAPEPTFGHHLERVAALSGGASAWGYRAAMDVVRGARTLLFFGVTGLLALGQATSAIDVTPVLQKILPREVTMAEATCLISIVGVWLRLVTKSPAFARWSLASGDATLVDQPEGEK